MNSRVERGEETGMNGRVERGDRVVKSEKELRDLASKVGQIAYGVHEYFGNGLLEKVYENALAHRLEIAGYSVERQKPLPVYDSDGFCVGDYIVDLFVNDCLIVELKAVKTLAPEHLAQVLNYLNIARRPIGLLINFGSFKFERRTVVA
jgi:GxxExxY protein